MKIDWKSRIEIFIMIMAIFSILMRIFLSAVTKDVPMLVFSTVVGVILIPSWVKWIKEDFE